MSAPVPFSRAAPLLLLALPGVVRLGRALAAGCTNDRATRPVLALGLGLCLWIAGVHAASLVAGSLSVGLPVATLGLGAAGLSVGRAASGRLPGRLAVAAAILIVAPASLRWWFHDELPFVGHMSTAAALQNGVYPPRHLGMPDVPLRYHYGFDLVAACLTAMLRLQVDRAIDVATLALFGLSFWLFRALGGRATWLAPMLVLFGGGLPIACDAASLAERVLTGCSVRGAVVNAPVTSFVFQHPWSLGLPVAAVVALLVADERPRRPAARLFALGLALAVLSLSEIVLFAAFVPAVVVAEAARGARRGAAAALAAGLALGAARVAGGFFAVGPAMAPLRFSWHAGFGDTAWASLSWNAQSYGALLPLGLVGALVARRGRVFWTSLAAGGVAIPNLVRFEGTADIAKFATVGAVALAVLGAAALARLASGGAARRACAATLAVAAMAHGVAFAARAAVGEVPEPMRRGPVALDEDQIAAMSFVRSRLRAGELIFRGHVDASPEAVGWAQWGGVPQPVRTWTDLAFGLPGPRLSAREIALAPGRVDAAALAREGVAWLVVDPGDASFERVVDGWVAAGRAQDAARFGRVRVLRPTP